MNIISETQSVSPALRGEAPDRDDSIHLSDIEIRLFENERIPYDRSERMPFTHAAKLSRNLLAARDSIERLTAENAQLRAALEAVKRYADGISHAWITADKALRGVG